MRILYLTKSVAMKAGVERVFCDKMNWLAEHGYDILLVTYEQGNHSMAFPLHPSISHKDLDTRFFKIASYSFLSRLNVYNRLRKKFKKNLQHEIDAFNPDIVITTTYQLKLIDLILSVNTNAKLLIESHIACYKAKKSGDFPENTISHKLAKLYDSYCLSKINRFKKLIVLTKGDASDWRKYISNVEVIPNPITYFPLDEDVKRNDNTKRIICVGRLNEQKGFDILIDAFSRIADSCKEWHVDIYGDGGDKEMLQSLICQKGLENRIIINPATSDIYKEYMQSDFLVLSSRYEGYPLVLNEAMSCGLPCVAFNCKYGPADAIENGVDGILVPNGDVQKLADSILWMIRHEVDRKKMGSAARLSAAKYKKDMIMERWVNLFNVLFD